VHRPGVSLWPRRDDRGDHRLRSPADADYHESRRRRNGDRWCAGGLGRWREPAGWSVNVSATLATRS
jgi:hypothetical protein